jgi:hypothetical protein
MRLELGTILAGSMRVGSLQVMVCSVSMPVKS